MPPQLYNNNGEPIRLGQRLGRGGEGEVYQLASRADHVAKIYHHAASAEKAEKLRVMSALKSEAILALTAWPVDVLYDQGRKVTGFVMANVGGNKDIHHLYSPKSRKSEFSAANFQFIVRTASNVARAFGAIHETGTVIGDVNHGGVTVSPKATVKLIDCDSFQITSQGRRFFCEVGVSTFTPPELQGRSFKGVIRTPNHDNFGLAVLVFHLLFMGRHPFAGRPVGREDVDIERAITEFRFAYSGDRARVRLEPPPNTLQLRQMTDEIALLFERAFDHSGAQDGARPRAREWVDALDRIEKSLKACPRNMSHHFPAALSACPWCGIEAKVGIQLFGIVAQTGDLASERALQGLEQKIAAIMSPGPAPFPTLANPVTGPSSQLAEAKGARFFKKLIAIACIAAAFTVPAFVDKGAAVWTLIGFLVAAGFLLSASSKTKLVESVESRAAAARNKVDELRSKWMQEADEGVFLTARQVLTDKMKLLRDTRPYREELMNVLRREQEKRQREHYLDRFNIEMGKVPGIGPARSALLASYNIETALDIDYHAIIRVPGFGKKRASALVSWRRSIENRFRFNPNAPFDKADLAEVDRKVELKRQELAKDLLAGANDLRQLKDRMLETRGKLRPQIEAAIYDLAAANADAAALKV